MIEKQTAYDLGVNVIESDKTLSNAKDDLIEQLKGMIPNVINADGQIDTQALSDLVDAVNTTSNNQGYELTFAGKGLARAKADEDTAKELKYVPEQSKDTGEHSETENVIIRGDNIDALKVLYKNYHNSIKMIYIDPPYNTKKENFVYNDDFRKSESKLIEEYDLGEGTIDFLDNVYGTRSHSGWLSFMYPRLKLARELLNDEGVIFISIDENELFNLKIMCDEIFGEDNFIESISWNKRIPQNDKGIGNIHEYVLLYVKDHTKKHEFLMLKEGLDDIYDLAESLKRKKVPIAQAEEEIKKLYKKNGYDRGITLYNSFDENYKLWGKINMSWPNATSTGDSYTVLHPITKQPVKCPDRGWRWKRETFDKASGWNGNEYQNIVSLHDGSYRCGTIWFAKDHNTQPSSITYLDDVNHFLLRSILSIKSDGGIEVEALFENKNYFSYPKPTSLLRQLIGSISFNSNDTILDFFAGSGTTAHAVMQQNVTDNINRKYILVQLDEELSEKKSKPAIEFCKNNNFNAVISSITIERINRAGDKIESENPDANLDIGYKVYTLTDKPVIRYNDETKQLELPHGRASHIDTLINMLVATVKPLHAKIKEIKPDAIYEADDEIYVIGGVKAEDLAQYKDKKINIDPYADFALEDYLNLDIANKENVTVVY